MKIKFLNPFRFNSRIILLGCFFFISPFFYNLLNAQIIENDEDGHGFTITFNSPENFFKNVSIEGSFGTFYDQTSTVYITNNYQQNNVDFYLRCYAAWDSHKDFRERCDFGLMPRSIFIVRGYSEETKYIDNIIINWCNEKECGGILSLYASSEDSCPFREDMAFETNIKQYGDPLAQMSLKDGMESNYKFSKPVKYIALCNKEDKPELARFHSLSIHFVDELNVSNPPEEEQLVWQDAEGKKIEPDEEGNYHHETTFGKDNNVVRLANGNPYDYKIKYLEPNNTHPTEEISLLDLTEETPEIIRDEDGYRDATEKECSIVGNTINFNAAGNYKITHETQPDAPTLYVTVAQAKVYVQVEEEHFEYFNPSSNQYTLEDAISFTNDQGSNSELIANITISDFNVSITPNKKEGNWVTLENYSEELSEDKSEEDLYKAAYEAALIGDIFNQYKELVSQRLADQSNVYIDVYIDGFFSELAEPTVTEASEGSGHFNLTQIFPCSGVYDVTISPNPQGNFIFDDETTTIKIIPNLYGMFGNIPGFNINGYGFTVENPEEIQYPTDDAIEDNLKNSVAYKPGTYFDSGFSIVVNETTYSGVSATMNENVAQNTNWINFEFSTLVASQSKGVKATVMKNGATGVYNFTVYKNEEIPTAVENIEAGEKGDAVYYNLHGVPVLNPGHGVYIRIINGKAEKIVM